MCLCVEEFLRSTVLWRSLSQEGEEEGDLRTLATLLELLEYLRFLSSLEAIDEVDQIIIINKYCDRVRFNPKEAKPIT